ncbi:MAG: hypothetical protein QM528_02130 [Phycisphaerales bacterium]|nr:hypothetical protein [Phycisphaerales bacterium]
MGILRHSFFTLKFIFYRRYSPQNKLDPKIRRTKWLSKMGRGEYIKESEW